MTAEDERRLRPLALLVHAIERVRAAALLMPALMLCGADCEPALRDDARRSPLASCASPRARSRFTLATPAIGPGSGSPRACCRPSSRWTAGGFACVEHLEDAGRAIGSAIVASECDLMAVPDRLSSALGGGLALYATIADGSGI